MHRKQNRVDGHHMDSKTRQNLLDAGCSKQFADDFALLQTNEQRLANPRAYRRQLLSEIHDEQRKLETLDFLIYRIRSNEKEQA